VNIYKDSNNLLPLAGHSGNHTDAYSDLVERLLNSGWQEVQDGKKSAQDAYLGVCKKLREGIADQTIQLYNENPVYPVK
jgi:hypothetical protein